MLARHCSRVTPSALRTSQVQVLAARQLSYTSMTDAELDDQLKGLKAEKNRRQSTLILGAAGAIGKQLCAGLAAKGHRVIASDRMESLPSSMRRSMGDLGTCVGGIDVTNAASVRALFEKYADANTTVWNLAAPLSVDTALNPAIAEAVTVGGMRNTLAAMAAVGAKKICFTDSIGSFGASSPRRGATAKWLIENPTQDPGSDYGRQKRGCRELMEAFTREHGGDSRFAVLPGVLHTNAVWGNGTTEYALDALLTAPHQATRLGLPVGEAYVCPVDPDVMMPMVFADDLIKGLIALQEADADSLDEPQHGYCIPGLSFTPNELFAEIRKHHPGFGFRVNKDENMNKFANLWPDEVGTTAPLRDLGYAPEVKLPDMVATVLAAHEDRNERSAAAWMVIDDDGALMLTREKLEKFIREFEVRGRETYEVTGQLAMDSILDKLMDGLDHDKDGRVSWKEFSEWNRNNNMEELLAREMFKVELSQ